MLTSPSEVSGRLSHSLLKYSLRRLFGLIPVLFIIVTASFFLMRLAPGGPFDREKISSPEIEENMKRAFGLDESLGKQYVMYLGGILRGDLGVSFTYPDKSVSVIIARSFGVSFVLGVAAFAIALIFGMVFGILSAAGKGRVIDHLFLSFTVFGVSVPSIVLGPILVMIFGVWLGLLPVAGWGSFSNLILPAFTLSLIYMSFITRITRASVLEVMNKDYVKTARGLGMGEAKIVFKYVLRGSLLPVISYIGPAFAGIITGSLVVERIFFIPGLGQHFVQAGLNRDYPLALGVVIFFSAILLLVNWIADVIYALIDPRVEYD